jgi:hypothetical protein
VRGLLSVHLEEARNWACRHLGMSVHIEQRADGGLEPGLDLEWSSKKAQLVILRSLQFGAKRPHHEISLIAPPIKNIQ